MEYLVYLLSSSVTLYLDITLTALLVRMLADGILAGIIPAVLDDMAYAVTEPFVCAVRSVLERFGAFDELPIDPTYLFTSLILILVEQLLLVLPIY